MMMKNSFFGSVLLAVFFGFLPLRQTAPAVFSTYTDGCEVANNTFSKGEELTYKIYYNWNFVWLAAGEVTLKVEEENGQYHFQAIGDTYDSYEWFFKVHDEFHSWVDKKTLLPTTSERSVQEGGYRTYEKVQYNQQNGQATIFKAKQKADKKERIEKSLSNCTHDVLSIFYSMRNRSFRGAPKGKSIDFNILLDQEQYNLDMTYLGYEYNVKVKGNGKFHTQKFQPRLVTGNVFNEENSMTIWVSNDENQIPVLIESPLSVGSGKAVLKEAKGLRFPLSAKVK